MEELGGMRELTDERTAQLEKLKEEVKQLNEIKSKLQESIRTLNSEVVEGVRKNLEQVKTIIDVFENEFLSPQTGFNAQITDILNGTRGSLENLLKSTEDSFEGDIKDLEEKIKQILSMIEEAKNTVYETGIKVGEYKNIGVIQKILHGEKISKIEAIATMGTIIEAFQKWCFKNVAYDLISPLDELKKIFDEMMKNVSKSGFE